MTSESPTPESRTRTRLDPAVRRRRIAAAAAHAVETQRIDTQLGLGDVLGTGRAAVEEGVRAYLTFAVERRSSWNLIASATSSRHPSVRAAIAARTQRVGAMVGGSDETAMLVRGVLGMPDAAAIHLVDQDATDVDELTQLLTHVIWAGVSSLDETA